MGKPKIRFKGYTEEWEQRKLGDLYTERNERGNDSLQILSVSIHSGVSAGELDADNLGKTVRRSEDKSTYKHVYEGDLIFNMMRAWQGAIGVAKNEGMISPAYISAIPNDVIYPPFMNYLLRRKEIINQINNLSYGVTDFRKRLYWNSFVKLTCEIPAVEEQKCITRLLESLDHLITLHQRKYEETQKLKKYMLQKMFPQNGKKVPEIRFAGFTEEWEQRKLDEEVEFYSGLTYSPDDVIDSKGTFVLRSSNVKNGEIVKADDVYVSSQIVNSNNVKRGDIIVVVRNGSRALIGKHAQIKEEMPSTVIGAFMTGIRAEQAEFINALLDTPAFDIEVKRNLGATINQITGYMFSKMEFLFPKDKEEQKRIGDCFTEIDNLITLHQRKCDELRNIKKFMLQNMFV